MVVLVVSVISPALRGEEEHKQDIDTVTVVRSELLILSHWQSFVTTEKQWHNCRRMCNLGDYPEPAALLLLLVLYILTQ